MAKIDCTDLQRLVAELAYDLASTGAKDIDAVVAEMKKLDGLDQITREAVVESIIAESSEDTRAKSELQNTLDKIKREARSDKALNQEIDELHDHINQGTYPPKKAKTPSPAEIERLRSERDSLQKQVLAERRKNDPDLPSIKKAEERIRALQKHLDEGTLPAPTQKAGNANPWLREVQERVRSIQRLLRESEIAQKTKLVADIDKLVKRIEANEFSPAVKPEAKAVSTEVERLRYQKHLLERNIRRKIDDLKPKTVWGRLAEPLNVSRAFLTSFDLSAVFRQGGFTVIGHPVRAAKVVPDMFRAFGSEKSTIRIANEILTRPNSYKYDRSGLYLAPVDGATGLTAMEEAFMSKWAEKIPLVRASERAYVTFLNRLRSDSFDAMTNSLGQNRETTLDEEKAIANFINIATGRGDLGMMEKASVPLATLFFSPKLVASRFQLLTANPLRKALFGAKSSRLTSQIAGEYARYLIGMALVYALGSAAGGEIERDPRSSDFGKIRFGNTRLDPLSGVSQTVVVTTRVLGGETKSTRSGAVSELRGEKKNRFYDTGKVIHNFLRSKLAPAPGLAYDLASGENFQGETTNLATPEGRSNVFWNSATPLAVSDVKASLEEQGLDKGTVLSLLAIFGMGVQTYGDKKK